MNRLTVSWSYMASLVRIISGFLMMWLLLKVLTNEFYGIWVIFMSLTAFFTLLDFGFSATFARNITYLRNGFNGLTFNDKDANLFDEQIAANALHNLILTMFGFYKRVSILLFSLSAIFGTIYLKGLVNNESDQYTIIYISWFALITINSVGFFFRAHDALLQGFGLVLDSKRMSIQFMVCNIIVLCLFSFVMKPILAVTLALGVSTLYVRWSTLKVIRLKIPSIYTRLNSKSLDRAIIRGILPHALKTGITAVGSMLTLRSSVLVGAYYLTIEEMSMLGLSLQIVEIIASVSGSFMSAYLPMLSEAFSKGLVFAVKKYYVFSQFSATLVYMVIGVLYWNFFPFILRSMDVDIKTMSNNLFMLLLIISYLESMHSLAGAVISSRNDVPFLVPSLLTGLLTIVLLFVFLDTLRFGFISLIIAPGLAQLAYQNWQWPLRVWRELGLSLNDYKFLIVLRWNKLLS